MEVGRYNVPEGNGVNLLGQIGYSTEEFFSVSREPNNAGSLWWMEVSQQWLQLARSLQVRHWNPAPQFSPSANYFTFLKLTIKEIGCLLFDASFTISNRSLF
jgi:hypothetical protein